MYLSLNMFHFLLSLWKVSKTFLVSDVFLNISDSEIYFLCLPPGSTLIMRVFYTNFVFQLFSFKFTV